MILSAQTIREILSTSIIPFYERTITFDNLSFGLSSCGYDIRLDQDLIIQPNTFTLGSSMERLDIPYNIVIFIKDKSTWARRGIFVQNTVAEPGWRGYLTLEISNDSDNEIRLLKGTPIAQLLFEFLDKPTLQPYKGKYQDQEAGPNRAK